MEIQVKEIKKLKVVEQNDIKTYMFHFIYLCVILSDERYDTWYMNNFIQIYTHINAAHPNPFLMIDYSEDPYKEILYRELFDYQAIKGNILDFVIGKINQNQYVYIYTDEYYLPVKIFYKKTHFVHESLIYGFNYKEKILYSMSLDKSFQFTMINYDFNTFQEAYEMGKVSYKTLAPWVEGRAVNIFSLNPEKIDPVFSVNRFLAKLKEYIYSIDDHSHASSQWDYDKRVKRCGLEVYDVIKQSVRGEFEGLNTYDYRAFHLIAEHKKGIYKRLNYIISIYGLEKKLSDHIMIYKKVVDQFEIIRIKYLHQVLLESSFKNIYQPIKKKHKIIQFCNIIDQAVELEQKTITDIYKKLAISLSDR
jgi:hypothetical protein